MKKNNPRKILGLTQSGKLPSIFNDVNIPKVIKPKVTKSKVKFSVKPQKSLQSSSISKNAPTWNSLLKSFGYKKVRNQPKYINPKTGRAVSRESAKNKAAKELGYSSYEKMREAQRSVAYKRISEFAKLNNKLNLDFEKLFSLAWQEKSSDRNKPLAKLLKYVNKISKFRSFYKGGL